MLIHNIHFMFLSVQTYRNIYFYFDDFFSYFLIIIMDVSLCRSNIMKYPKLL
jgi:hypothetical protein